MAGDIGAYSYSTGYNFVRQNVKKFLEKRDGHDANANELFLTQGSTESMDIILNVLIQDKTSGVMVPKPVNAKYPDLIRNAGGYVQGYDLDEDNNWRINIDALEEGY